mgnify:CR=1 FL=1
MELLFSYERKQKSSTADTVLQFLSINFYAFRRSVFFTDIYFLFPIYIKR